MAKRNKSQAGDERITDLLAVHGHAVDLARIDPGSMPGLAGGKGQAKADDQALTERLAELQGQLFAMGRHGGSMSVLLLVQGLDTSGKSGALRHISHRVNALGLRVASFSRPTAEELDHHFLWRIRAKLPAAGQIALFDRSHYEDVVAAPVRGLIGPDVAERRYAEINAFEQELVDSGTAIIKCFLHISQEEQRRRLLARLDDPSKIWKLDPSDLDDRRRWDELVEAYEQAFTSCSIAAPWYVVPADHKWYRDWALARIVIERMERMKLHWPEPELDPNEVRQALDD